MLRNLVIALTLAFSAGPTALAQDWATKMFETAKHDFGVVARGAKAEYEFVLTNPYVEDVHVAAVRVSCGCTTPRIGKETLKTYEKGAIVASINSERFSGKQGSTITVTIDKPFWAQVQLQVSVYIQGNVVVEPASVALGRVDRGTAAERKAAVRYTGGGQWTITQVKSANPHLSGKVVETTRDENGVCYELQVQLAEKAPAGLIREHLILVTSDPRARQIPVLVEGEVVGEVTVSPSPLFLGSLRPGEKVTKQLVVRGKKALRVLSATTDCEGVQLTLRKDAPARPVQLIPVTFTAGEEPGKVTGKVRIETDLGRVEVDLLAYVAQAAQPQASGEEE